KWLKQPGDQIKKGDILAEIETDKATMDLESYDAGVLEEIMVQEGETVPIGQAIARIGTGAGVQKQEQPAPAKAGAQAAQAAPTPTESTQKGTVETQAPKATPAPATPTPAVVSAQGDGTGTRIIASPIARRMAEEHGI